MATVMTKLICFQDNMSISRSRQVDLSNNTAFGVSSIVYTTIWSLFATKVWFENMCAPRPSQSTHFPVAKQWDLADYLYMDFEIQANDTLKLKLVACFHGRNQDRSIVLLLVYLSCCISAVFVNVLNMWVISFFCFPCNFAHEHVLSI